MAKLSANGVEVVRFYKLHEAKEEGDRPFIVEYSVRSNRCILTRHKHRNERTGRIESSGWTHRFKLKNPPGLQGDQYVLSPKQKDVFIQGLGCTETEPVLELSANPRLTVGV